MANIKQIDDFKSKYLRMAGFVEYVQQVLKLFKDFRDSGEEGQSQLPEKVEPAYTSFKNCVTAVDDAYKLSRASDFTQKIADEDTRRDNLYTALKNQVQMYTRFDFDAEKKSAATYLWNIMKKYGVDVKENYSEESGKLQQMIQELEADNVAGQHITALGLTSIINQLKTANEAVRTLMSQRNDERMQVEKSALFKARNEADEAYRNLILMLNAATAMDDDAHRFDELISQVNELIKYYRQYVVSKKGTSSDTSEGGENEASPNNGGGSSNGGSQNGGGSNTGNGDNTGGNSGGGNSGGGSSNGGGNTGGNGGNTGGGEEGDAE